MGRWDAGIYPDIDLSEEDIDFIISRQHAILSYQEGTYLIKDCGSQNGTFLNRQKCTPHQFYPLKNGDELALGSIFFRFMALP